MRYGHEYFMNGLGFINVDEFLYLGLHDVLQISKSIKVWLCGEIRTFCHIVLGH